MVPVPVGGPKGAKGPKGPREGVEQRPYDSTVDDCKNLGAKKKSNGSSLQNPTVNHQFSYYSPVKDAWNGHNQIPIFTPEGQQPDVVWIIG